MTNNTTPNSGGWSDALMQCIRKRFATPKPASYEPPNPAPRRRDRPVANLSLEDLRGTFREQLRAPAPEPGVALRKSHLMVAHGVLSDAICYATTHETLDAYLKALQPVINAARSTPEPESPSQ